MKITQMIRLIEADELDKPHIIGDSHAVAMAPSVANSVDLGKNGASINAVNAQAQGVPDNVGVILSAGNNNVLQQQGAVANLSAMIDNLITRGCTVVYVGFPPIDLNNKNPSTTANTPENNEGKQVVLFGGNRIQEMTPEELAAFNTEQTSAGARAQRYTVPEFLPLSIFYRNKGYTQDYNNFQQQLLNVTKNKERAASVTFVINDINPADPLGIHARPNAYARVAGEAVKALEALKTTTDNPQDSQPIAAADQLSPEEFAAIDLDGNGEVTVGEYNQYAADNDIDLDGLDVPPMAGAGLDGIFGILMAYIKRNSGEEISLEQLQDTISNGEYQQQDTSDISGDAQLSTTGNQAENALILAARQKWANVQDREVWICALIAQCRVETGNFRLSTEVWGPTPTQLTYDIEGPRPSKARQLGNTAPGDGKKYRGRGWIQLTGKANYQAAAGIAGADIVNQPDLAAQPAVANRTAIHYFETRVMNRTSANDIQGISRLVNGGTNGMAQRIAAFEQLMDNLRGQQPIEGGTGRVVMRNQNATRNKPIQQRLTNILQAGANAAGVDVVVFSGGQDTAGTPNARRTGSTRHDNGRAADVWLYDGGTQLRTDRSNPKVNAFIAGCVRAGALGMGAGPSYMGGVAVHVDIASQMTWGAGGRNANTPGWLTTAYNTGRRPAGNTRLA